MAVGSDLLIANSHAGAMLPEGAALWAIAKRLKIPLYRQGIPIFDRLGHGRFPKVGYRGTMQFLFEIANLFLEKEKALVEDYERSLLK